MTETLISTADGPTIALHALTDGALEGFLADQPPLATKLAQAAKFKAKAGQFLLIPGAEPGGDIALFGLGESPEADGMAFRALPAKAPLGDYKLATLPVGVAAERVALPIPNLLPRRRSGTSPRRRHSSRFMATSGSAFSH